MAYRQVDPLVRAPEVPDGAKTERYWDAQFQIGAAEESNKGNPAAAAYGQEFWLGISQHELRQAKSAR